MIEMLKKQVVNLIKNSGVTIGVMLLLTTSTMVSGQPIVADVAIQTYDEAQQPYVGAYDGMISGQKDAVMTSDSITDVTGTVEIVENGEITEILNETQSYEEETYDKTRVIVMTDGEGDDRSSMVRFLLYANEMDIEAIIQTNSYYQIYGHSKNTGELWLEKHIEAYGKVLENLRIHDSDYPSDDVLMSKVYIGDEDPNHVEKDSSEAQPPFGNTEGSDRIIEVLLDDDERPVWVQAWGGTNTVAQALYELKYSGNYSATQYNKATGKLRIHAISYQDDSGKYIESHFPEVLVVKSYAFAETWGYQNDQGALLGTSWVDKYIDGHGPLSDRYIKSSILEGDTPSYLNAIMNGLRGDVHPTYGGWGGQFYEEKTNLFRDLEIDGDRAATIRPYIEAAQNDFAVRLDWSNTSVYEDANHHPVIITNKGTDQKVVAGQTITIDPTYSVDPDGDNLKYQWRIDEHPTNINEEISITTALNKVTVVVPSEAKKGQSIHLILAVTDDDTIPLTTYKRFIFTVI